MFFYVDALPVTPDYAHFTIIEAAKMGGLVRGARRWPVPQIRCRHSTAGRLATGRTSTLLIHQGLGW
jgi:hypothetical protein